MRSNVPLADFTTWRVGGPAQWLLEPTSVNDTLKHCSGRSRTISHAV